MSSSKKQIVIDHGSLSSGGNNTTLKRQRKIKPPPTLLRPSTLKQNLLKKIQEHKQRSEETPGNGTHGGNNNSNNNNSNNNNSNSNTLSNEDLSNQFKISTNYLEQLINKKKEARKHNKKSSSSRPLMQQPMQQQMQPMQQQMQPMQQPMQPMQQQMQPMQQQMQPMQQQMQPMQQQMQPMQMQQQVSLELPPELQLNPITIPQSMVPMPQIGMPQSMTIPQIVMPQSMPVAMPVPQIEIQSEQTDHQPDPNPNPNPTVLKDVPYGCLRGGNKPTYRTYHRGQIVQSQSESPDSHNTTVKKPLFSGITVSPDENVDPMIQERQRKLREIQENFQTQTQLTQQSDSIIEPLVQMKNKIKQTITKKYKLGKTPGSNVVGVLIKNSDTRRRIQEEHGVLRRESIVEIRKYLHDHGLIKVGSDAPPDVLRNIYESAKMTGEISNTNKHVMLHNFMKSEHENADSH
jgi:hypothetical protein